MNRRIYMDQQTWIITFTSDGDDGDYQANTLEEFLLQASVKVVRKPTNEHTQGGWTDLIVPIVTSGTAVAVVTAIGTWIKSTHGATIDVEIKEIKVRAQ